MLSRLTRKKWTNRKKAQFLIHVGRLLEQGYRIHDALAFLSLHQTAPVQTKLQQIKNELKAGRSIHEAFYLIELPKDILTHLYISEKNGGVDQGFQRAGEILGQREELKARFQKLLRYPLFLLWVTCLLIFVMFQYLLPHLQHLFTSIDADMPFLTVLFFRLIEALPWFLFLSFVVSIAGLLVVYYRYRTYTSYQWMTHLVRFPILKEFLIGFLTFSFSSYLSGLLKGGLPVIEALKFFEQQNYMTFFQEEASVLLCELKNGERLSDCIEKRSHYQKELAFVIANGEKTGYLATDLQYYSMMLYRDFEDRFQQRMVMIQPILFMLIGGLVLVMFLAMMLPVFQMIGAL
ncbi:competence type IV pilus assembly protein ComGB [Halalkalibacterium ligniniphilum]|uniref:competence type IV pilus assembly protein ComGB n=1 Tax=Halalkalibacterium ligniniphilum TaxID=1134413 RepID=UPI00034565AC|nr:competence type IV pilus assembly protein ComGB [Halalkalibacterium ligniniphilum]